MGKLAQALSVLLAANITPTLDFATVERTERTLSPGVTAIAMRIPETPCEVRMIKFDFRANPKLRLDFVLGTDGTRSRLTPEALARKAATARGKKPVAGLNGDFFLYEKKDTSEPARPFGVTVQDGKLLERGCWDPSGYEVFARARYGRLVFGKLTSTTNGGFKAFVDGMPVKDVIRVWNRPLQKGKPIDGSAHSCYPQDTAKNYPRSLVGVGPDLLVFFVADARQPLWSLGLPSVHAAEILRREGCTDAGQFDGGGSTSLWACGEYLNRPSDGKPRPVANGLVVVE